MADAMKPVWPAEREVGVAVYERVEKLVAANPSPGTSEWAELDYLSHLTENVEEVGGYDGPLTPLASPPAREEAPAEGAGVHDVLRRFRDLMAKNDDDVRSHHHPIWVEVAEALRARTSEPESGEVETLGPSAGFWSNVITHPAPATADKLREIAKGLDAAMSWVDYPFVENNTPEAEIRQRLGFMQKDAEPHRQALTALNEQPQ